MLQVFVCTGPGILGNKAHVIVAAESEGEARELYESEMGDPPVDAEPIISIPSLPPNHSKVLYLYTGDES